MADANEARVARDPFDGAGLEDQVVLVVDDSPAMADLLREVLEAEGLLVQVARTGAEALRLARQSWPALITLDLGLPGLSGWEVVEALQAEPALAAIPVIAVSAHAHELDPAFRARVAHVVAKPFYASNVAELVLATLARSRSEPGI
jgi:CheY-like chemotaxis protein